MRPNKFLEGVVEWLNANNIHFKTAHTGEPIRVRSIRKVKGSNLQIVFQDGVKLLIKGVTILRDLVNAPFDLIIRGLTTLLPKDARQEGAIGSRPIVITLFSLFSLFSVFGLFSLIRLL
jgi:hypothetical protein